MKLKTQTVKVYEHGNSYSDLTLHEDGKPALILCGRLPTDIAKALAREWNTSKSKNELIENLDKENAELLAALDGIIKADDAEARTMRKHDKAEPSNPEAWTTLQEDNNKCALRMQEAISQARRVRNAIKRKKKK